LPSSIEIRAAPRTAKGPPQGQTRSQTLQEVLRYLGDAAKVAHLIPRGVRYSRTRDKTTTPLQNFILMAAYCFAAYPWSRLLRAPPVSLPRWRLPSPHRPPIAPSMSLLLETLLSEVPEVLARLRAVPVHGGLGLWLRSLLCLLGSLCSALPNSHGALRER
jgi:hypothetical protein